MRNERKTISPKQARKVLEPIVAVICRAPEAWIDVCQQEAMGLKPDNLAFCRSALALAELRSPQGREAAFFAYLVASHFHCTGRHEEALAFYEKAHAWGLDAELRIGMAFEWGRSLLKLGKQEDAYRVLFNSVMGRRKKKDRTDVLKNVKMAIDIGKKLGLNSMDRLQRVQATFAKVSA